MLIKFKTFFLFIILSFLQVLCANDKNPDDPNFVPGIVVVGFNSDVHYDSALAILKKTNYEILDMYFLMYYYHGSNDLDKVIDTLQKSVFVGSLAAQPKVTIGGKDLFPISFRTHGVTTASYYYDLLRPYAGESYVFLSERSGFAQIKVPIGLEIAIAEELERVPAIAWAEPSYYGEIII